MNPLIFNPIFQSLCCWLIAIRDEKLERKQARNWRAARLAHKFLYKARGRRPNGPHLTKEEKEWRAENDRRILAVRYVERAKVRIRRLKLIIAKSQKTGEPIKRPFLLFHLLKVANGWILRHTKNFKMDDEAWKQQRRDPLPGDVESSECSALCNVHPSTMRRRLAGRGFALEQRNYYGPYAPRMTGLF